MAEKRVSNRSSEGVVAIRHPRTDFPQQGWIYQNLPPVGFDPALQNWSQPTDRLAPGRRYLRDTNSNTGWLFSAIPAAFDPATQDWHIKTVQTRKRKWWTSDPQQFDWLYQNVLVDPSLFLWTMPDVRTRARKTAIPRGSEPQDTSWVFPNLPVVFDPAIQGWTQSTDRTAPGPRYRRDTNVDVSWIFPTLPYDPAIQDWHIDSGTSRRRRWWSDSPLPAAWLVPSVVFDPALWPGTTSHSHRLWKAPKGRWQPDLDNAWIPPFDATTQFAAIGIPGTRTPARARLQMSRYQSLYDMSFVPVTGFIRLRPIAPIMSARRRNKRR